MVATLIQTSPDAELVSESRRGSREAFGRIVRRYQGMVTGVIYSFCGDFHCSEDLAQDTFISAWKSLSAIDEPEKLAPWLCQIARRKSLDYLRASSREKERLANLSHLPGGSEPVSPAQDALTSEERDLLWRILSELPQPYRETMVLYYRQGQSTAAVALAMETTEDAVRQRLARGRQMLREQVGQTLERNLARSAPGPAFALVVLAALPALAPEAAKAATLAAAAKGSASVGGGALSWAVSFLPPFVGILGGSMALRGALRSAQSPRERRFIVLMAVLLGTCLLVPLVAFIFMPIVFHGRGIHGIGAAVLVLALTVAAASIISLGRRKLNAIQRSEAPDGQLPAPAPCDRTKFPLWLIVVVVATGMAWMFNLAWKAGDMVGVSILSVVAISLIAVAVYCWRYASAAVSRLFSRLYVPILCPVRRPHPTLTQTAGGTNTDYLARVNSRRHPLRGHQGVRASR
jgi:RNA polymerase sigma factor (sigma-70 family)